jgi:hypothetical protein
MKEEKYIFITTDPLGRQVALKADTWSRHIKEKHGEDLITYETIKKNVENPLYITQNVKPKYDGSKELIIDPHRQDYWDLIPGEKHFYLVKTIVEFEGEDKGTVVTTYLLRNLKEMRTTGGIVYDGRQNKSSK